MKLTILKLETFNERSLFEFGNIFVQIRNVNREVVFDGDMVIPVEDAFDQAVDKVA